MSFIKKANRADRIADNLVRKFNAPQSRKFFCKCAWKMSEDEIYTIYEESNKPGVQQPIKYFVSLCTIKMRNR